MQYMSFQKLFQDWVRLGTSGPHEALKMNMKPYNCTLHTSTNSDIHRFFYALQASIFLKFDLPIWSSLYREALILTTSCELFALTLICNCKPSASCCKSIMTIDLTHLFFWPPKEGRKGGGGDGHNTSRSGKLFI